MLKNDKIAEVIKAKGWADNLCSRFLVHTGVTPYSLAKLSGCDISVVSRWVSGKSAMPSFVNWAFLVFEKLLLHGINVLDYF